jgi:RNA polymerase sigma factor (sigma-70 family)
MEDEVEGSLSSPLADGLEARIAREEPLLLAAARLILFNDADAWDVTHTTIEIALRQQKSLRDPESLHAWLLTIQSREAFRLRRRLRRFVSMDQADDAEPGYELTDDELCLRDALRNLPPRTRNAIVLHHMTGMTVKEIAASLGVSHNTVKSQLKTGLARLRDALRDGEIERGQNG